MKPAELLLTILEESYSRKAWHGPNLKQSIKGVTAEQAAWRSSPQRHNIWELTLHAAYWKYVARRRIEGAQRGFFALPGHNFFPRPEPGKEDEAAWKTDRNLLESEHQALKLAVASILKKTQSPKILHMVYGVALHDVYHAGQIRLLRRLQEQD